MFVNDISVRTLAKELKVSHGTLSRITRGYDCDSKTMTKIINWLF